MKTHYPKTGFVSSKGWQFAMCGMFLPPDRFAEPEQPTTCGNCRRLVPLSKTLPLGGARIDPHRGLYNKFRVSRTDRQSLPGRKHHGCEYFVLDLDHDPFAVPAIRAYAEHCRAEYPRLAQDLDIKASRQGTHDSGPSSTGEEQIMTLKIVPEDGPEDPQLDSDDGYAADTPSTYPPLTCPDLGGLRLNIQEYGKAVGFEAPVNWETKQLLVRCLKDLETLAAYVEQQLFMDTITPEKMEQLNGSKPYVVVPQIVLARLMEGANATVEYIKHAHIVRQIDVDSSKDLMVHLYNTQFELENKMRLSHGLSALPRIVR